MNDRQSKSIIDSRGNVKDAKGNKTTLSYFLGRPDQTLASQFLSCRVIFPIYGSAITPLYTLYNITLSLILVNGDSLLTDVAIRLSTSLWNTIITIKGKQTREVYD